MNVRGNARLTLRNRVIAHSVVVEGQRPTAVAAVFGVCIKTVCKWARRYCQCRRKFSQKWVLPQFRCNFLNPVDSTHESAGASKWRSAFYR
ncbi:hypothetical protein EHS39_36645 [Ensifer sp. MPMI2T]|nr:hypothetical protein EHS39_36645 [Ensifer sp. MPMI2T]